MFVTVTQFAEQRNISGRYVRRLIQDGKITSGSWKQGNRGYLIDPARADRDMKDNVMGWSPDTMTESQEIERLPTAARLEIQDKAVDVASTGEESGHLHPWPVWAARYISALVDLDPGNVDVERIDKTHWRLTVHDFDTEAGEPVPWTVDMAFNFNLGE